MNISICADDIGQDPAINEACLDLFALGRLSQVSVMSSAPFVKSHRDSFIQARKQGLQVGLHFNLTLGFSEGEVCRPLHQIILLSQLRLLNASLIQKTVKQQLDQFENIYGFAPNFIDGHQHIHQFPQIRQVLIEEVLRRYADQTLPWFRSTVLSGQTYGLPETLKCNLLNWLGGNTFLQLLDKNHLSHNDGFLGVYGFNATSQGAYRSLMRSWLSLVKENTLIMCHPAIQEVKNDAIGLQRPIEYQYLKSDAFLEDLQTYRTRINTASVS
jgi:predicted glycoside hydrolase/deacetylase ChbG (UPF0249 family)